MANDNKPELNLDDWDSLPLDPSADDWDEPQAAQPDQSASEAASEDWPDLAASIVDLDVPTLTDQSQALAEQSFSAGADPALNQAPDSDSNWDNLSIDDSFLLDDLPLDQPKGQEVDAAPKLSQPTSLNSPPDVSHQPFNITDESLLGSTADKPAPEIAAPPAEQTQPAPTAAPNMDKISQVPDVGLPVDQFEAHLTPTELGDISPSPEDDLSALDENIDFDDVMTKKVELDIDGIFLDDQPQGAPPLEEEPAPEPAPPPDQPSPLQQPTPEPPKKRIPKVKMLVIIIPALLAVTGLAFGVYKFLGGGEEKVAEQKELVITPEAAPREPMPGELPPATFYIAFPGQKGDTLVEMTVVLYYPDLREKRLIEDSMPMVRDIIFRSTQGKGAQVIANGQMQSELRDQLTEAINKALGDQAISYVQITQIRILN